MGNDFEVRLFCDGVLVAVETNHVDYLSAELVGVEWVEQDPERNEFEVVEIN